jgi:hypothetical protein
MLTYASRHGHAFIDRELYLPRQWTRTLPGAPRPECLSAGVPFRYFAAAATPRCGPGATPKTCPT